MSTLRALLKSSGLDRAFSAAGPSLTIVLILCAAYALALAIFLLASFVAGLVLGQPKTYGRGS